MQQRKSRIIYLSMAIIAIVCLALSIVIEVEKMQFKSSGQSFCSAITGTNGCETVQTSNYSSIMGISNPLYGMMGFTILATLAIILAYKDSKILRYLAIIGSAVAASLASWFLYIQAFILHTYCIFCLIVDFASLMLLGLSIYLLLQRQIHKRKSRLTR